MSERKLIGYLYGLPVFITEPDRVCDCMGAEEIIIKARKELHKPIEDWYMNILKDFLRFQKEDV